MGRQPFFLAFPSVHKVRCLFVHAHENESLQKNTTYYTSFIYTYTHTRAQFTIHS